jgi:hypothetical protein
MPPMDCCQYFFSVQIYGRNRAVNKIKIKVLNKNIHTENFHETLDNNEKLRSCLYQYEHCKPSLKGIVS